MNSESFSAGSGDNGVVLFHTYLTERIVIGVPQSADSAYIPHLKKCGHPDLESSGNARTTFTNDGC